MSLYAGLGLDDLAPSEPIKEKTEVKKSEADSAEAEKSSDPPKETPSKSGNKWNVSLQVTASVTACALISDDEPELFSDLHQCLCL